MPRRVAALLLGIVGIPICAAISALPSSAQEQSSQPASTRDLQSIIEAKVLRVAVTQFDLPGFHAQRPDGTLVGAEIELAQQIAQALGVGVQFIKDADSFDAVVDLVASGKADIGIGKSRHGRTTCRR